MSWRLKSPAIWLFVEHIMLTNIKEDSKASHYWPFVRAIHRYPVDSPQKGIVTRQKFQVTTRSYEYTQWIISPENEFLWDLGWSCFCRDHLCIKSLLVLQQIPLLSTRGWPETLSYGRLWSPTTLRIRHTTSNSFRARLGVYHSNNFLYFFLGEKLPVPISSYLQSFYSNSKKSSLHVKHVALRNNCLQISFRGENY